MTDYTKQPLWPAPETLTRVGRVYRLLQRQVAWQEEHRISHDYPGYITVLMGDRVCFGFCDDDNWEVHVKTYPEQATQFVLANDLEDWDNDDIVVDSIIRICGLYRHSEHL